MCNSLDSCQSKTLNDWNAFANPVKIIAFDGAVTVGTPYTTTSETVNQKTTIYKDVQINDPIYTSEGIDLNAESQALIAIFKTKVEADTNVDNLWFANLWASSTRKRG